MTPDQAITVITEARHGALLEQAQRIHQLEDDLAQSRKATEAVQEAWRVEEDKLRAELIARADTIVELTMKHSDAQSRTRRTAGELMQTLMALRNLLASLKGVKITFDTDAKATGHGLAWHQAEEVLKLMDIPF